MHVLLLFVAYTFNMNSWEFGIAEQGSDNGRGLNLNFGNSIERYISEKDFSVIF